MALEESTRRQAIGLLAASLGGVTSAGALGGRGGSAVGQQATGRSGIELIRIELARMLETNPLPMEAGYRRLEDGMWMVASLHHLAESKGAMVEWWHRRRKTVEEFRLWHPLEHVHCEWDETLGANVYHHLVEGRIEKTKAQSREAANYFNEPDLARARVSATICARGGPLELAGWGVHIVHLCRDTDYGCQVRTRLFFGDFEPAPPAALRETLLRRFDEERAQRLMRHQSEEYVHLARFLPALYAGRTG